MPRSWRATFVCLLIALAIRPDAAPAQVVLRGGERIEAPVTKVSIAGVQVAQEKPGEKPRIITWDRVRSVLGEHAGEAAAFATIADQAWRARTRLARGDITLAQPLFEALFERFKGADGPTALVVAQGLLQCRLARLAQASAVDPWLEVVRLRDAGWSIDAGAGTNGALAATIDTQTGLAPELAPIWLDGPATGALASRLKAQRFDDPNAAAFAALYQMAAAQAAGLSVDMNALNGIDLDEPAPALIAPMIAAMSDDADTRRAARTKLLGGLTRQPGGWTEAWRRVALGRSLLLEDSLQLRRRGMVQLLHAPARFARTQRYLAGVALALVAEELRREGDGAGADRLVEDLTGLDPQHPAIGWLQRRQASAELPSAERGSVERASAELPSVGRASRPSSNKKPPERPARSTADKRPPDQPPATAAGLRADKETP